MSQTRSQWVGCFVFFVIANAMAISGCGGSRDAAVKVDANDPYLVESQEIQEYVPLLTAGAGE